MPRKVILDVDPGIDDAIALSMALFDPRLEVLAVTAVAGNVSAEQATRNVQVIIEQLDPPRLPRLGAASPPENGLPVDGRHLNGIDGLGGVDFEVAELRNPHPSEKIICDLVRAEPEEITIVALGPLTNIARAFQRDAELASLVGGIVMCGGAICVPGNIRPAAEFNIFCDPLAAASVFRSRSTKTLIPLDVTNQITLNFDLLNRLPDETTRVGRFLRAIVPPAFRAYRQQLGLEGIHVHDTIALIAALRPDLFQTEELPGEVETIGEVTIGATIFDRRHVPEWRPNMDVALGMDIASVSAEFHRCLAQAARRAG